MDKNEIKLLIKESEEFIQSVIERKYCHVEENEKSWEDVVNRFQRVLKNNSTSFYHSDLPEVIPAKMKEKKFIPAGSVLYGFGYQHKNVSMSNCYFIPITQDSIEGIYDFLKRQARTYSYRGGVGTDISILRPKGTKVNNSAITSSGAVSFMPLLSESTNTIGQNGRRGAHIITISDWHPDVLDFIKCKSKPEEVFDFDFINNYLPNVYYANISVKLSDKFFEAYEKDEDWQFVFPDIENYKELYDEKWNGDIEDWKEIAMVKGHGKIKAKEMLKMIAESAWRGAEPGVLYWDNALKETPWAAIHKYRPAGVNPCGEQILPGFPQNGKIISGNCNLHAIVLYRYVRDAYTERASFDFEALEQDLPYFLEFGDHIIDINKHPLKEQTETDKYMRKVGIEFTGLGDALAMLGIKYGTDEALTFTKKLFKFINKELFKASIQLAKAKGCAPIFNDKDNFDKFIKSSFIQRTIDSLDEKEKDQVLNDLYKYKLRNSAWTTAGPTGSVSIIADNCTSGIEPLFQLVYKRNSRLLGKETVVVHLPLLKWLQENAPEDLDLSAEELKQKYNYVEAHELNWKQRLKTQATIQKWITDSISSTVNLPANVKPEEIMELYYMGWKLGLKGVTIYRDGSLTGVLNKIDDKKDKEKEDDLKTPVVNGKYKVGDLLKKELLDEERAVRYIVKWKGIKVYIIAVYDEIDGMPLEIFAQLPIEAGIGEDGVFHQELYMERLSYWHAISRLLSLAFRYSVPLDEIKKQLKKSAYSIAYLPAILVRILNKFPLETAYNSVDEDDDVEVEVDKSGTGYLKCPVCGEYKLVRESGCEKCLSCGYSKCE